MVSDIEESGDEGIVNVSSRTRTRFTHCNICVPTIRRACLITGALVGILITLILLCSDVFKEEYYLGACAPPNITGYTCSEDDRSSIARELRMHRYCMMQYKGRETEAYYTDSRLDWTSCDNGTLNYHIGPGCVFPPTKRKERNLQVSMENAIIHTHMVHM